MSVRTTADEKIDAAREKLEKAIDLLKEASQDLSTATHRDTWGSGEYRSEYTSALEAGELQAAKIAIEVKTLLKTI